MTSEVYGGPHKKLMLQSSKSVEAQTMFHMGKPWESPK